MTNIVNGNYPVDPDKFNSVDDLITKNCASFNKQWKEKLSFHPAVCSMTWEQRREMKKFAEFIFDETLSDILTLANKIDDDIQQIANEAYADGLKDAKQKFINDAKKKFQEVLDNL
jgi:Zn-dependent M32 family carboxypeptidase